MRTILHEELDGASMEVRLIVLRGGAAFDEVEVGTGLDDDEGVLELASA